MHQAFNNTLVRGKALKQVRFKTLSAININAFYVHL